ncbi:MAG TPA: hypothetical protein VK066_21825 [Chloroflexota bacterium]|nr:hypothetical protein [Chloroflexota bacterium]
MYLQFGMTVVGSDGNAAGTLDHVLVAASRREVTHVVVRSPEVSEDVLLPLNLVQGNAGDALLLQVPSAALGQMARYYEGRTSSPPAGRVDTAIVGEPAERRQSFEDALAVPADALQYGPETRVATRDGATGRLVGLGAGLYVNRLSELRAGGLGDQEVSVPEPWIGALEADAIIVTAAASELGHLVGVPANAASGDAGGAAAG